MNQKIQKIVKLIDQQQEVNGQGYFRDEIDNINHLEESLRHLSVSDCEALSKIGSNEFFREKILVTINRSKLIAPNVKKSIVEALK